MFDAGFERGVSRVRLPGSGVPADDPAGGHDGGGAFAGVIVGGLGYPALALFAALLALAVVVAGRLTRTP